MTAERDYYEVLGVARGATDGSSSARSASSPSSSTRTSTRTPRRRTVQGDQRGLPGPVGSPAPPGYDLFGRAGDAAARTASAPGSGLRRLRGHLRRVLRRGRGRRRPARPAPARRRPPLRPPDHVRGGRPRRREGDRVPGPRALRDVPRRWRQGRHQPLTCPQCDGRGEIRTVRQTMLGQMVNVAPARAAAARAGSSRRPATPATARAAWSASARCGSRSPPGIDDGHQIRLSNEGEAGPRGGPAGSLYVAVHVAAHPTPDPRGHRALYEARGLDRPGGAGGELMVPTVEGEEEVEIKPGTQPGTEIRLRGRGVPHLRRPRPAATST